MNLSCIKSDLTSASRTNVVPSPNDKPVPEATIFVEANNGSWYGAIFATDIFSSQS